MKLIEYHRAFLDDHVNLNGARLDLLESRVESIYAALANDDTLGPAVGDYIRQGSWAHRTIIRPVNVGDEFDADILVILDENPDWEDDKARYITETLAALGRSAYKDMAEKHTRCVRVIYKDDCHVDVVPYVERDEGGKIINSKTGEFESSNPAGFSDWMRERDDIAHGNLRKVIRLLKYLRDFKGTFSVPSAILTALLGERVFALDADARYADVPTALKNIVSDLDDWLQWHETMPTITDPSCPDVTFNHRWDLDRYANFRNRIHSYSAWIDDAHPLAPTSSSPTARLTRPGASRSGRGSSGRTSRRRSRRPRRWSPSARRRPRPRTAAPLWSR